MKSLSQFQDRQQAQAFQFLLTDLDGTLTQKGRVPSATYRALESLEARGVHVIAVTGRPAGWCEMMARWWPVSAVVGENGAFWFRLFDGHMKRHFVASQAERERNQIQLARIQEHILREVPGSALASDQFTRLFDLAIDFAEDVPPLDMKEVLRIKDIFEQYGATAKISNIHVNGWFGQFDKLSTSLHLLEHEFKLSIAHIQNHCLFVGDSPNDEPMFAHFQHSFAVSNIQEFQTQLKSPPRYRASQPEAQGFCEIVEHLLLLRKSFSAGPKTPF